ncbi:MAG: glycosyltransferase family 1 protein [Candidatus Electrothrix sp. GM3_4]|nr:glycosyltransferase family 1 protein [Candidatus Electrothrix sp. GM3_4]
MKKNNVLFINPGPAYRVTSTAFQIKYKYLSAFCSGYIFSTSNLPQEEEFYNFHFVACRSGSGLGATIRYLYFCFKHLLKLKRDGVKLDLIITYDPLKTGLIGLLAKSYLGGKLVVEVNGVYDSPVVWEDQCGNRSNALKKYIFPKVIRFVLKRSDGIKLLFSGQIDGLGVDLSGKIVDFYFDWVNTELFHSTGEDKEVLFAGFPFRIKGVDILICAFKRIAANHPDWSLKILGWYPDQTELEAAIGGHSQIFHHLPVSATEMIDHIGKCGFLVQPSRTEAMGRVLVEAMAAGKARIGTRVDGIPTVINDGVDGLLVEVENVEELAEKMDLLIRDEELRRKLGTAASERVRKEFSAQKYVQLTSEFYQRVIGAPSRGAL